jgi:hypothetical protein
MLFGVLAGVAGPRGRDRQPDGRQGRLAFLPRLAAAGAGGDVRHHILLDGRRQAAQGGEFELVLNWVALHRSPYFCV